jgi:hypothetical protein
VAELIFRLRDQNGRQSGQPGACDIFETGTEDSPAHRLVKIGYDAVPQLISVLEDKRFSRSVGYHRDFYFSHHVLTVGDCALAIIQAIAGRRFYERTTTSGYMSKDGEEGTTRQRVEAWWKEFQKKGEKTVLVEATEEGGDDAPYQADRLVKKYPDVALPAIMKGASQARPWTRAYLVGAAGKIPGEAPVPFLLEEVEKGPAMVSRLAAAKRLHARGRPEGIPAMVRERERCRKDRTNDRFEVDHLIRFLAGAGDPNGVQALGKDLRGVPVTLRLSVIETLGNFDFPDFFISSGAPREKSPPSKEFLAAVEEVLAASLDDTEARHGIGGSYGGKSFEDPRIGDVAAHFLSVRWKEKYSFDLEATPKERDRQRIDCINQWRKGRGEEPLPLPGSRKVASLPEETIRPLLNALRESKTVEEAKKAVEAVEKLGLPALGPLHAALPDLHDGHVSREAALDLARRLSTIVAEVKIVEGPRSPDTSLKMMLDEIRGRPLSPRSFIGVLLRVTTEPPEGVLGVELTASRDEDLTGMVLQVKLLETAARKTGTQVFWSTSFTVVAGTKALLSSSGSTSIEYGRTEKAYEELARAISQAVSSAPDLPPSIHANLVREE